MSVITFSSSTNFCCIDNEITGINIKTFNSCLKQLWVMNSTLFQKIENLYYKFTSSYWVTPFIVK